MPGFSIACPECGATLKSNKPVAPGKVITCPKCEVMFAAPKPKPQPQAAKANKVEVLEEVEIIDDVEIIGESKAKEEGKAERPKGGAPKARRGKAKRKKMSTLVLVLMFSGFVVGIGGLGIGGWLVWKYVINAPSEMVAYVPDDAALIVGADLGRIMSGTSLAQVIDFGINSIPVGAYFRTTNTTPKTVLDRAVAVFGAKDWPDAISFTVKSKIDKEKFNQAIDAKPTTFAGRDAFQLGSADGWKLLHNSPKSVSIIDPSKRGEEVAQQVGKSKPAADIATMVTQAAAGDVWVVLDADSSVYKSAEMKLLPAQLRAGLDVFTQSARCCGFWVKLGQADAQFTLLIQVRKSSSMKPEQMVQTAKTSVDQLRPQIDTLAKSPFFPAQLQGALPVIGELSNSITFSSSGDMVIVKAKAKSAPLEKAIEELIRGMIPSPRGR